jgi:hypothetical protein
MRNVQCVTAWAIIIVATGFIVGCQRFTELIDRIPADPPVIEQPTTPPATTTTQPPAAGVEADEIDLSQVVWHGPDIRGWKIATTFTPTVSGGKIHYGTTLLKGRKATGDNGTTGNPWAIVLCSDGKWHASSHEWYSHERGNRPLWTAFDAGHWTSSAVKGAASGKGTVFYVALATVSRGNYERNGDERTAFKRVVVP